MPCVAQGLERLPGPRARVRRSACPAFAQGLEDDCGRRAGVVWLAALCFRRGLIRWFRVGSPDGDQQTLPLRRGSSQELG